MFSSSTVRRRRPRGALMTSSTRPAPARNPFRFFAPSSLPPLRPSFVRRSRAHLAIVIWITRIPAALVENCGGDHLAIVVVVGGGGAAMATPTITSWGPAINSSPTLSACRMDSIYPSLMHTAYYTTTQVVVSGK